MKIGRILWPTVVILLAATPSSAAEAAGMAAVPGVGWALPFTALLLSVAVLPLAPLTKEWWEHNGSKLLVGLALGALVLAHYGTRGYGFEGHPPGLATVVAVVARVVLEDYLPFLVLLFSLYVIAGGLQLRGDLRARPATNTAILGLGAAMASLVGTTGASMVLIRPLLQTNQERKHVRHTVIFFIFLVSNIGGCLLPLGDPPLFLGYIKGVPFLWTTRLVLPWLFCVATLLAVYYLWDRRAYRSEAPADIARDEAETEPVRLLGSINLVWLLGIVLAVALLVPGRPLPGTGLVVVDFVREGVMLALVGLSLATTPRGLRKESEFSYGPIIEVACLFLGIFLTMTVPIEILQARGPALGLATPGHFFWASGGLSSFLDNAPTYVVFFEAARALGNPAGAGGLLLPGGGVVREDLLAAISLGAVFMGANTYIGNGPNLMVKAIAEGRGVRMPGFFGYMAYSALVLLPLFGLVWLLFLSGSGG
ncbi:MAG TPA: sodium:proton antiporter [Isosphaeraceae bacterium]|nr:sodium:proton antiporter [Isosphaeraceae bacterium]